MLVLSRSKDEEVVITLADDTQIVVMCVDIRGDKVRLGFNAPKEITIHRREVQTQMDQRALAAQGAT